MSKKQTEPSNRRPLWKRKKIIAVLLLLALICVGRPWCAALLDGVRHTVNLSFTIEWGPTYWVDYCMAALGRPGIERLCATTADDKIYLAYGAQNALAGNHDPEYASLFIAAVSNPNTHSVVRNSLLRRLCAMQNDQANDFIKSFVHDEKQSESDILTVIGSSAYYDDLLPMAEEITAWSHRPKLARAAFCGLAESSRESATKKKGTVPELYKLLSDEDVHVRWMAVRALGQMGEIAVPVLRESLGDQNKEIRYLAIVALGKMWSKAKDAVPELRLALSDNDETIRSLAAIALGRMGSAAKAAADKLREVRDRDQSQTVRNIAHRALVEIVGLDKSY